MPRGFDRRAFFSGGKWPCNIRRNPSEEQEGERQKKFYNKCLHYLRGKSLPPPFQSALGSFLDHNRMNDITANCIINYFHPANNFTENRVAAIEMGLRRMRRKPLRPTCIFTRKSHSDRAAFVRYFVYLATNLITRSAVAIAARITVLDYEVGNNPMNCYSRKVAAFSQLDKVVHIQRRILGK